MADDLTRSTVHWLEGAVLSSFRNPVVNPPIPVTGDRSDLTALTNLLVALEDLGLIDDQTVA